MTLSQSEFLSFSGYAAAQRFSAPGVAERPGKIRAFAAILLLSALVLQVLVSLLAPRDARSASRIRVLTPPATAGSGPGQPHC